MHTTSNTLSYGSDVRTLFGFEILEHIGVGAGSQIYAADDPQTGQIVALKHVKPVDDKGKRFVEQLQNEFEIGRKLTDSALRRCFDMKVHRSWCHSITEAVLVMEFVDATSLEQVKPPDQLATATCFLRVAGALNALHHAGHVHCDLKPGNILRNDRGDVKVIDLGQACPIGTKKPRVQGTPDYISPEQVRHETVTPQTDVYNFGATMYTVLTGTKLPTAYTVKASPTSFLLDTIVPSPNDLDPTIPIGLSALVMDCVRTCPSKRPGCMSEVMRRLEVVEFKLKHDCD